MKSHIFTDEWMVEARLEEEESKESKHWSQHHRGKGTVTANICFSHSPRYEIALSTYVKQLGCIPPGLALFSVFHTLN